jgi:hypothetical protein
MKAISYTVVGHIFWPSDRLFHTKGIIDLNKVNLDPTQAEILQWLRWNEGDFAEIVDWEANLVEKEVVSTTSFDNKRTVEERTTTTLIKPFDDKGIMGYFG